MARHETGATRHLFLSGFMGAGKSTVGPELARRLGREFFDLDDLICEAAGCSVVEIFAREGEDGFRRLERAAVEALFERAAAVVALGGGAVTQPELRRQLRRSGTLVTLSVRPETVRARLAGDITRPLLSAGPDAARALLEKRSAAYLDADLVVETDDRTPHEVAEAVLARLDL